MRSDLIARLAAATEPSRELDAEIVRQSTANCVGVERSPIGGDAQHYEEWLFRFDPPRSWVDSWLHVPRYTANIDAALTLVPEGHWWTAGDCRRESHARVAPEAVDDDGHEAFGATVALAICIAAIRARGEG